MVFGIKLFTVQCGYRPTCKTHSCSWLGLYRTSWSWNEDSNPGLLLCTMGQNSLWSRFFMKSNLNFLAFQWCQTAKKFSIQYMYLFLQSQHPKLYKFSWIFCLSFTKCFSFVYCVFFKKTIWLERNPENLGFVLSELVYGSGYEGNGFKYLNF